MNYDQVYLGCMAVGLALSFLWFAVLIVAQIWGKVWNWIDDGDSPVKRNPVVSWVMSKRGYMATGGLWLYGNGSRSSDGEWAVFIPALNLDRGIYG